MIEITPKTLTDGINGYSFAESRGFPGAYMINCDRCQIGMYNVVTNRLFVNSAIGVDLWKHFSDTFQLSDYEYSVYYMHFDMEHQIKDLSPRCGIYNVDVPGMYYEDKQEYGPITSSEHGEYICGAPLTPYTRFVVASSVSNMIEVLDSHPDPTRACTVVAYDDGSTYCMSNDRVLVKLNLELARTIAIDAYLSTRIRNHGKRAAVLSIESHM